jgi:hypothetical protein
VRALVAALLGVVAAYDVACDREAPHAAADSARADSVALASLPPALADAFGVRAVLTPEALRDTASVRCELLAPPNAMEPRRRLRARLADSSRTVLFVRASRGDTIRRVELVRRERGGEQRGFIWDAATDTVQSIVWRVGARRPEVSTLPRGGPVPRALRALGRRLLALPCTGRPRPAASGS